MMVRTASGLVECTALLRTTSGLVECGDAKFRSPSGIQSIGSNKALSANVSRSDVFGATGSSTSQRVQTNSTEASAVGGKAPFTYSWAKVSGGLTPIEPSSASTAFYGSVGPGSSDNGTFICTITDAAGKTAQTRSVSATIENYGGGGGNINLQ